MTGEVVTLKVRRIWTLRQAADLALQLHWKGMRKEAHARGWCRELCETFPDKTLFTLTTEDLITYDRLLEANGLDDETRKARMSVVSTLYNVAEDNGYTGEVPSIPRPYVRRKLKWWLHPELEREVLAWLQETGRIDMRDFVLWQRLSGLRVEESLAVLSRHFLGLGTPGPELEVPGTKNTRAHATMPLSQEAAALAMRRLGASPLRDTPLFSATYKELWTGWQAVRLKFGLMGIPTATLKALRRSYARDRAARGAPLPVIQQLMRHGSPTTTMGYLRLTGGGFSTEEMRQWVGGQHGEGA